MTRQQSWVRDDSGLTAAYVAAKTWNCDYGLSCTSYALLDDQSNLLGGVVLHDFDGVTVFFSIALEDNIQLRRSDLDLIQHICFDSMRARRMATRTPVSNTRGLRMARIVGLKEEGIERQAGPNSDDVARFALLSSERRQFARPADRGE